MVLPLRLSGEALAHYELLDEMEKSNWEALTTALGREFGRAAEHARQDYTLLCQRDGESLSEFARRVGEVTEAAFLSEDKSAGCVNQEELKIEALTRGVLPAARAELMRHDPQTWTEALKIVRLETKIKKVVTDANRARLAVPRQGTQADQAKSYNRASRSGPQGTLHLLNNLPNRPPKTEDYYGLLLQ
ncbi:hypothetical protein QR680_014752 [Steinernema hermaphroditum]|uniref:Retrotransposon gag domain-containing protein n=1 Tax=Steinernema hermaphroditum TaxID=289476 RepID=A0AA39IC78_9BILA|nr:hypothetical protein QR680_014752 [Steinernema hermaphroditum]